MPQNAIEGLYLEWYIVIILYRYYVTASSSTSLHTNVAVCYISMEGEEKGPRDCGSLVAIWTIMVQFKDSLRQIP